MNNETVLIVEDSHLDLEILKGIIEDQHRVVTASNGEEALSIFEEVNPALVLMDVVMDGMDGYECCSKLKAIRPDIPVIFVSSNSDTEEVVKGLHAGGYDYLFKPIDVDVLLKKVTLAVENQKHLGAIKAQERLASEVAFTAMSSASDLGAIIEFLRELTKAQTLDDLSDSLISSLNVYNLNASFMIHHEPDSIIASNSDYPPPLDIEILKRAKEINHRIFERGARLIITYGNVSFLVKNLPSDNAKRIGELRDCLAILAESADEVYRRISAIQLVERQRANMLETLAILNNHQELYKASSIKLLDELATEVELLFCSMDLTLEQEQAILSVIKGGVEKGLNQMEIGLEVDEKMKNLTATLQTVTTAANRIAH